MGFQLLLVAALLLQHPSLIGIQAVEVSPDAFAKKSFDFIVVGGGTAGLAIATRLSDDRSINVGVIEAGQFTIDNNITIPGFYSRAFGNPTYDWGIFTAPEANLGNRQISMRRGKLLGGTSAINGMVHTRASKVEYNDIAKLTNSKWDFDFVQAGIKKSENWTRPLDFEKKQFFANDDPENHGTKGAIHTSAYPFYGDIVPPFFKAFQNSGIRINKAAANGDSTGIFTINGNIDQKNASRSYSANGYYVPNAARKNLVLVTGAQVTKIITETKRDSVVATGVQFLSGGRTYTAKVNREVILSAGTVHTPQILELSGIGNKTLLNSLSIPVKVDLPGVGENVHDHYGVIPTFESLSNLTSQDALADPEFSRQQLEQYVNNRTGMYTAITTTVAFLPMQDILSPAVNAQLKTDLDAALKSQPAYYKQSFDLMRSWLDEPTVAQVEIVLFPSLVVGKPEPGKRYFSTSIFLQHPWSRGNIHITTSNPLTAPVVKAKYLTGPAEFDIKFLVEVIKWVQKVTQTEPLKSATIRGVNPPWNATDAEIREFIVGAGDTEGHISGTASMLPRGQRGVVDGQLKVYGTKNIRVCDLSILPVHVGTHPIATLYGIAEQAADALRTGQWT